MIGIDISDRSIKIAEILGEDSESPELKTVCWSPLPPNLIRRGIVQNVPAVSSALKEAFLKCSPRPVEGKEVVASIPESQSFVRVLDVPVMEDKEMDEAVQWAVRQHIPFDLDRVYLDWQPLPASVSGNRRQVLVGAAQRNVVDPLLAVLDGAELKVRALELEAQAIVRSLLPRNVGDSQNIHGVLILDIGATATNVIYFDGGVLRFTAGVQSGGDNLTAELADRLHLSPDIAAEKKAVVGVNGQSAGDQQVVAALHEATVKLLGEVGKIVREMTSQITSERPVQAILLSGGTANLPGIHEVINEVFPGIPVQMGNPWTNILVDGGQQQAPLSPTDASHFVTAMGLALRPINAF